MTLEKEIIKHIADSLQEDEAKITLDSAFEKDLRSDSLAMIELSLLLEDKYNLSISDEKAQQFKTVRDVVDYINQNYKP